MAKEKVPNRPMTRYRVVKSTRATRQGSIRRCNESMEEEMTLKVESLPASPVAEPIFGQPPVWAESRPALCDALPWFRAVQGGMYHHNGFCWGFLLEADSGDRVYIDDEIVITRIGGGCTKDKEGNLTLHKDQGLSDVPAKSLLNNKAYKVPVGLIIGSTNTMLKQKLPHRFNVMGWFRVTDVWHEKIGKRAGLKVRFEKLDLSEKSWWATQSSPAPLPPARRDFRTVLKKFQCGMCGCESPQLYSEGWMCLQPTCPDFWKIEDERPQELSFDPIFLKYRNNPDPGIKPHYSLVPDLLSTIRDDDMSISSSRIAWRGIVCPKCSKCVQRVFWNGWKCKSDAKSGTKEREVACDFVRVLPMHPVSLRSIIDDPDMGFIQRAVLPEPKGLCPVIDDESLAPFRKCTYTLPDNVGLVTHFISNKNISRRPGGPDDLFHGLQTKNIGLRRYCLQQSVVAETLTAHFAVNYGMPYKYVVAVDSKGFDEASEEILSALGRLSWATKHAVAATGDKYMSPNELLVIGYFEGMKMGYHDDGESSLGPTIATFSLGSKSTMTLRMKYKYYHGHTKSKNLLDVDPVLYGCKAREERLELKSKFEEGAISLAQYNTRRSEILKASERQSKEASPVIKMELFHGDFVVMHGENLQKYYEHMVVPEDKMRFALTARYIKPEHVTQQELERGRFSLPEKYLYDGK